MSTTKQITCAVVMVTAIMTSTTLVALPEKASRSPIVRIYNKSGETLYIALVKTQNYTSDKKLYIDPKDQKVAVKPFAEAGTYKPLLPNTYVDIHNFVTPPGIITKYNRSLWISEYPGDLKKALNKKIIQSNDPRVTGVRVGSAQAGVLLRKGQGIALSTSSSEIEKARGTQMTPAFDEIVSELVYIT